MINLSIDYICEKTLTTSSWVFDPVFLEEGEMAKITGCVVASDNPLYLVENPQGITAPVYKNTLIKHGRFLV